MHNTQCNIYIYTVFASAVLVATAMYGFSYLQNTTAHVILKALISRDAMYNQGMMIAPIPRGLQCYKGCHILFACQKGQDFVAVRRTPHA